MSVFGRTAGTSQVILAILTQNVQFFNRIGLTDYRRHWSILLPDIIHTQFIVSFCHQIHFTKLYQKAKSKHQN
jgi:hypothetical protein